MGELVLRFQKSVFPLTLAASLFLGFSIAYSLSIILPLILPVTTTGLSKSNRNNRQNIRQSSIPMGEPDSIVTGSFIRDSGQVVSSEKDGGADGSGQIVVQGVLAGDRRWARAAIQIKGQEDVTEYKIGDTVAGFRIISILSNSIVVETGASRMKIPVGEVSGEQPVQQTTEGQPSTSGSTKITISRSRLLALTQDQTVLYQNKFAPITKDGKILGVKLLLVPPNNFLFELGARTGDIIRRFNGDPLDNTDKMMQMWTGIRTLNQVTIELERGGKVIPYEINITN